jgi:predicted peptidase
MKSLIIILLLFSLRSFSQGPQTLVTVPITPWGNTAQGWLYLPENYSTPGKKCPVVLFYHGIGEKGTDPYVLLNQGLPQLIAGGMRPDNIASPIDGRKYSFIVLSLQSASWSPDPAWLPSEVKWLKENYRIDTNRIYVTGLSAGGESSFDAIVYNDEVSSLITAAVPMSPAPITGYDSSLISKYKIHTWFLCGDQDTKGFLPITQGYYDMASLEYPGSSRFTIYPCGHGCWNEHYDINYVDPVYKESIWQWMLRWSKENLITVLPTHFLNVSAKQINDHQIQVSFNAADVNAKEFFIEVSTDGTHFRKVQVIVPDNANPNKTYTQVIDL